MRTRAIPRGCDATPVGAAPQQVQLWVTAPAVGDVVLEVMPQRDGELAVETDERVAENEFSGAGQIGQLQLIARQRVAQVADIESAVLHDAVEQYLFGQRRDVLRLVSSTTRPDEEVKQKISVVEKRLVDEYGYDSHSAREALNYVTTLLAQE